MMRSPFLPLGITIVLLLGAVLGYVLWHDTVVRGAEEARELSRTVELRSGALSETASARNALAQLSADEAFVRSLFLSVEELVPFLERLERAGAPYGATVSVVSVSDAEGQGRVRIAFSVEGSFDAVMRTVGTIEYEPYASAIEKITIDTVGEGLWSASATLVLAIYDTP